MTGAHRPHEDIERPLVISVGETVSATLGNLVSENRAQLGNYLSADKACPNCRSDVSERFRTATQSKIRTIEWSCLW